MNPKGLSSVDRLPAGADASAPATSPAGAPSRRGLLGLAGLAGLAGAATAFASSSASAAPVEDRPNIPTDADTVLLTQAMILEITARDLYRRRIEVGAGDIADVVNVMAENHRAYGEAIAGNTGVSAGRRSETVYEANVAAFEGGREEFLLAAHALEQSAVATHTSLLEQYESGNSINLTASILVVEARHATVIADLLGADLATRLDNTGEIIPLSTLDDLGGSV